MKKLHNSDGKEEHFPNNFPITHEMTVGTWNFSRILFNSSSWFVKISSFFTLVTSSQKRREKWLLTPITQMVDPFSGVKYWNHDSIGRLNFQESYVLVDLSTLGLPKVWYYHDLMFFYYQLLTGWYYLTTLNEQSLHIVIRFCTFFYYLPCDFLNL